MNNEEARLAMPSAKKVIEALKKLGINNEKCPKCKGEGFLRLSKERILADSRFTHIECYKCNGTGKISQKEMIKEAQKSIAKNETGKHRLVYKKNKRTIVAEPRTWEWEPKVGEFASRQPLGEVDLIIRILSFGMLRLSNEAGCTFDEPVNKYIPILGWQEIEKILEKMGYELHLRAKEYNFDGVGVAFYPSQKGSEWIVGKDRQTAVTLALFELEKKLK